MTNFKIIKKMSINEFAKFIYGIKDVGGSKILNEERVPNNAESIENWLKSKTKISNKEKEVIFALAESKLNVSEAAKNFFFIATQLFITLTKLKESPTSTLLTFMTFKNL